MSHPSRDLIVKAIGDIADGRANVLQPLPPGAADAQRRARELRQELARQPMRPGVLDEAQTTAEEFFRAVRRLGQQEKLADGLAVKVRLADGSKKTENMQKTDRVRDLRGRIDDCGGLTLSGRPLQDDTLLFELWAKDGLGCAALADPPYVQVTVRNAGG